MNKETIKKIIQENPNQGFDICSVCDKTELHGQMNDVNEVDWDLICDDCEDNINRYYGQINE